MNIFKLIISSPDGKCFDGEIQSIFLRGTNGDLAILAGHIPFVTSILPCNCIITMPDGTIKEGKTSRGLLSVSKEQTILIANNFYFN